MLRRAVVITCVTVGFVTASFGSAQAATISPDKWAPKFCTAVQQYQETVSEQSDDLSATLESVTDLQSGRAEIVTFLGKMVTAAKTAARELKAAGSPSTPNGSKIAAKFVEGLQESAGLFADAKVKAAKLPTTTVAAFKVKGKQLGQDLSDAGERLGTSFEGIDELDKGKKLEKAIKAAPACSFLS